VDVGGTVDHTRIEDSDPEVHYDDTSGLERKGRPGY